MKLNEIKPQEGAVKVKRRKGRGIGSSKGKTCGVGVKGQKSRRGVAIKGFEGGQMPIYMRMPKIGFNNPFAKDWVHISLDDLQRALDSKAIDGKSTIDEDALVQAKVIRRKKDGVKLLAKGELKSKISLKISRATKGATQAVEKAGGSIELMEDKPKGPAAKSSKKSA